MLITLQDGSLVAAYDTKTDKEYTIRLAEHAMRFHIVDPYKNTARQHISTTDHALIDRIMNYMYKRFGRIDPSNEWIKIKLSRREFWPADNYRRIVSDDLARIFGNKAVVTGTSVRYIYYISDDADVRHSPDNIGKKFGFPLIYEGYAVASIFKINGSDVLSPGNNVVYWLSEPMWHGFHSKKRRVPKAFPGTTGFVATKWCQRTGYATYGQGGIDIAAMTQGKTVALWALNDLREYWVGRQGRDIFSNLGETFTVEAKTKQYKDNTKEEVLKILKMQEEAPFGLVGMACPFCGKLLAAPYTTCGSCGKKLYYGPGDSLEKSYCTHCGKRYGLCDVAQMPMTRADHKKQHQIIHNIWYYGKVG